MFKSSINAQVMKKLIQTSAWIFEVNESKPLHRNTIFWFATLLPLILALLLALLITSELEFEFTRSGYDSFLSFFKLPLWVASASLVLGVMVGRFHSSAQSAAAINQSKSQNNFSNYLNHRDHFQKYIQSVSDEFDLKIDAFKVYGIIFSSSTPDGVSVKIENGISEYYTQQFNQEFWSKMKIAAPSFSKQEVNIYFPRFAKAIGLNAEKISLNNYENLKEILIKIRKIYRRGMEYGFTRVDTDSTLELEESGFASLTGEFDLWAQENGFKKPWGGSNDRPLNYRNNGIV